ncbi:subtilisin-like protein [Saitoella complicata NRRL Y-17804]|nr:subtilisin-like protein [Saitoella complicata NRRL Y-17804]ODQ50372.1 subtilisin-like protein [Saitoella complicata NRRL Y-17804]
MSSFPIAGLLPKEEIQATQFISKNPEHDGRVITIAILDTGVDPSALGLQRTTDGKPKIIDLVDCTGSGDVKMIVAEKSESGSPKSLTGKELKLGSWENPSGEWRVGLKRAWEIWPGPLVNRMKKDRKDRFLEKHHALLSAAKADLRAFNEKNTTSSPTIARQKNELEARISSLDSLIKSYDDAGPTYDVVSFHDGKTWRVVVDSECSSDLSKYTPLAPYREGQQYSTFPEPTLLPYSVDVFDEGSVVSIVCAAGTHGTHVAAITAAYTPDTPERNGVAPGAQIVSLKIGDTRLGSMETHAGLVRAANYLYKHRDTIQLANMSYGEASGISAKGQFVEVLADWVARRGNCVFVTSAGNAGPALSTVGAPGNGKGVLSVGAWQSASMQKSEYALLDEVPAGGFTWSSRGPTTDGHRGVDVMAPGAAITSVPGWSGQGTQLMNGTSMASPNACGGVALVLSSLKAEGKEWKAAGIVKAARTTAKDVQADLNAGLIQVENMREYLAKWEGEKERDVEWEVSVGKGRGIYLRDPEECAQVSKAQATVKPFFLEHEAKEKAELEVKCRLECKASWIRVPKYVLLAGVGRTFDVEVDPSQLESGLHFEEIVAYDADAEEKRVVFTIPVTVTKPEGVPFAPKTPLVKYHGLRSAPGYIERKFVAVPSGATSCKLRITARDNHTPIKFIVHCLQMIEQIRHSDTEAHWMFTLTQNEPIEKRFKVVGGRTMEVCLAQFWNVGVDVEVDVDVEFYGMGLTNADSKVVLIGGEGVRKLEAVSGVRQEIFKPTAKLEKVRKFVRPKESIISPLGERDMLPNTKKQYELVLTYPFKQTEAGDVTASIPACGWMYDSAFGILMMVYDANKQLVSFGDVYRKGHKLEKGDHEFKIQIRHESFEALDKVKDTVLTLECGMQKVKEVGLDVFEDQVDLYNGSKAADFKNLKLKMGERKVFVVNTDVAKDKLPKNAGPGDVLVGSLSLNAAKVEHGGYKLQYVVAPDPKKEDNGNGTVKKKDPKLVDLQIEIVSKIKDAVAKEAFLASLLKEHPTYLPLLVAKLDSLSPNSVPADDTKRKQVNEAADAVIKQIDIDALARHQGMNRTPDEEKTEEEREADEEMSKKKDAFLAALKAKLIASTPETREAAFKAWRQWAPVDASKSDMKFALCLAERDIAEKRYGTALKTLKDAVEENGVVAGEDADKAQELKAKALRELGWDVWVRYEEEWGVVRKPPGGYALF